MNEEEWNQFLASGAPTIARVCRISDSVRRRVGISTDLVTIHHAYAVKFRSKHRIEIAHLPMIEMTIRFGVGIIDNRGGLVFFYDDCSVFGWTFQATLKALEPKNEIWLASFHKVWPAEVRRMMKKGEVIQRPM